MFYSQNENELMEIGYTIGQKLIAQDVLILTGELGAGKTTLTKGLAKGLGIQQMIKSPTYTIIKEYRGRLPLYHLDIYRIGNDPDSIDLDEFIFGQGVTVIEWGMLLEDNLPIAYLEILLEKEGDGRRLTLKPRGARFETLLAELGNH